MSYVLDGTVVRPPLTGVHYAVRHEISALMTRFPAGRLCCLVTDPQLRKQAEKAGIATPALGDGLRQPWRRIWWQQRVLPGLLRELGCQALAALAYTAPRNCPVPYLLQVHDTIALRRPGLCSHLNALHMRTLMPRSIRGARTVIVSSDLVRREVVELTGKPAKQVQVVPLGVDPAFLRDDTPPVPGKIAKLQPYLLFVGTIEPKKGVDTLLRAHASLLSRYPELKLVLVGQMGWKSGAIARTIERNVTGQVIHLGYQERILMPHFYRGALACVVPSREEGFGLTILEAMAAGTPVVHSDHPVLLDTAGGRGIPFPVDDAGALANRLAELFESVDQRSDLIAAARAYTRRRTWQGWAAQVAVLLESM